MANLVGSSLVFFNVELVGAQTGNQRILGILLAELFACSKTMQVFDDYIIWGLSENGGFIWI